MSGGSQGLIKVLLAIVCLSTPESHRFHQFSPAGHKRDSCAIVTNVKADRSSADTGEGPNDA
eukprot:5112826-Pyramimonas_sp.AAC.1